MRDCQKEEESLSSPLSHDIEEGDTFEDDDTRSLMLFLAFTGVTLVGLLTLLAFI